jgi:hypothetical protein
MPSRDGTHERSHRAFSGTPSPEPQDNQGNRDLLGACYLDAGRDSEALELLNRYPEQLTAMWGYTAALVQFRLHGDTKEAKTELKRARGYNAHVPDYLTGRKRMPRNTPDGYSIGSEDEAVLTRTSTANAGRKHPERWPG